MTRRTFDIDDTGPLESFETHDLFHLLDDDIYPDHVIGISRWPERLEVAIEGDHHDDDEIVDALEGNEIFTDLTVRARRRR